MFASGILDVAIGMVFVYLLFSLVCTAINEWVAAVLGLRASNLEAGIRSLLNEGSLPESGSVTGPIAEAIYKHGLVQSLFRQDRWDKILGRKGWPSYIPGRTFALTLFEVLAPSDPNGAKQVHDILAAVGKLPDGATKESLLTVINQANGDLEKARKAVEDWYNDGMDRVAGWYKRKTQVILLILGIIVAVGTNTDSVLVAKTLWNTPALRESTVKAADQFVQQNPPATQGQPATPVQGKSIDEITKNIREYNSKVQNLGLPIGWPNQKDPQERAEDPRAWPGCDWRLLLSRLLGWTLTAIAVSFGAPFWFDTLNKFMVVRSTVKPKEKSGVEGSKDAKPASGDEKK
jgi:hypothetical protein